MRRDQIKVGATYRNKGAGRTTRTAIAIGTEHRPPIHLGAGTPPDEPGVLFEQSGEQHKLYLGAFATWCGEEVQRQT